MTKVSTSITDELLSRLNEEVAVQLVSQVPLVGEVARYTIDSGGKRLRPILLLLSAGCLGYQGSRPFQLAADM